MAKRSLKASQKTTQRRPKSKAASVSTPEKVAKLIDQLCEFPDLTFVIAYMHEPDDGRNRAAPLVCQSQFLSAEGAMRMLQEAMATLEFPMQESDREIADSIVESQPMKRP